MLMGFEKRRGKAARFIGRKARRLKRAFSDAFWEYTFPEGFPPPSYTTRSYSKALIAACVALTCWLATELLYHGYIEIILALTLVLGALVLSLLCGVTRHELNAAAAILSQVPNVSSWAMLGNTAVAATSNGMVLIVKLRSLWGRAKLVVLHPQYAISVVKGKLLAKAYVVKDRTAKQVFRRGEPSWSIVKSSKLEDVDVSEIATCYGKLSWASPYEKGRVVKGFGRVVEVYLSDEPHPREWGEVIKAAFML